ncbi:MAG: PAS domain S-box protein, partial [Undibacterium sp.]|nr:PAS domain S-box protein [Undibacterium sp.]
MQGLTRHRFILFATLMYALSALVWIFLSDHLLALFIDIHSIMMLSTIKGVFFVVATAALFYLAMHAVPGDSSVYSPNLLASLEEGTRQSQRASWLSYGLSFVMTIAMLATHQSLSTATHAKPILMLLIFPVVISAMLGGLWSGLLSTLLAASGFAYFSLKLNSHLYVDEPIELMRFLFFLVNGCAISVMSEMLRRSLGKDDVQRRLLDAIVSGASDAIFVKDLEGRYLLVNRAASGYVGKPVRDMLFLTDFDLFSTETAQFLTQKDAAIIKGGVTQTDEEVVQTTSGQSLVFSVTKGPILDQDGKIYGLFGISRDITDSKHKQLQLAQSERKLKEAQQNAGIGNWEWHIPSNTHTWSEQIYLIYGRDTSLPPATYPEVATYFTETSWKALSAQVENCLACGESYTCDVEIIRANGSLGWILVRGQAIHDTAGNIESLHGTVQNITDRKRIELQALFNEERLQLALDANQDALWDWNIVTGKVFRSPKFYAITRTRAEDDAHDFSFFEQTIYVDDLANVLDMIAQHREGKSEYLEFEFRLASSITASPASTRWLRVKGKVVKRDDQGNPLRLVGTLSDFTERRQIDENLRVVLEDAGVAIWITDVKGQFLFANVSACELTGYSRAEVFRLTISDLIGDEAKQFLPAHLQLLETQKFIRKDWPVQRKSGDIVQVSLNTKRLSDGRYIAFGRDLTEEQLAQAVLREREQTLARVLEGADQGYWDWNVKTNHFVVSSRWETMLGYQPGEMRVATENWPELVHTDDLPKAMESIRRHMLGEVANHEVEIRCRTKSGEWRWILVRGRIVERDMDDHPLMMSGTHTDITEKKQLEQAQKDAVAVFSSSYEGIMVVNKEGKITKVNPAFSRISGYSEQDVVGESPKILSSGRHEANFYRQLWQEVTENDFWRGEIWNRRKSGEVYVELLSISVVRNELGETSHYIGVFSDISQIKAHEAELDRIAHYDILTGVPNRRLLGDRLGQAILSANRSAQSLAVCFLDLDGFKAVNDKYGHQVGDQLLIGVTHNLRDVLRANDTLARLGGDEFVILLSDITSTVECMQVLDRILTAVSRPVQVEEFEICVSGSIGVSLYPDDNVDADSLLRHADQAMYMAKNAGKNRYHLFDPESDRKAQVHRNYLELLTHALQRNEFVLYYQPKVDLQNGRLFGAEALIRWNHPERGMLSPIEFLSHIYGSSLEQKVGEWVIRTALAQGEIWHQQGLHVGLSVNISADHFLQDDFCAHLNQALSLHPQMPATCFELEILETAAIADIDQAVSILKHCRQLGVHFALDDFGTGYSSLTYLRKLPVDTIKIDQSFVRNMLVDGDDLG